MSTAGASVSMRPAAMKRASSGQGHTPKAAPKSPGSELDLQPLRQQTRPKAHASRVVLPRNHSSGRNLAKLARQAQAANDHQAAAKHARQRSHEGDTDIRLPGSLEESSAPRPAIRRNYTASNLPRNTSHTKLKKNLSHGHLQRLGLTRDLTPLTSTVRSKTPLSPGLRGKSKRPKSMDWELDKDLHTREVELEIQQQQEKRDGPKRVGFAVGSYGDDHDADDLPNMEGSGLDEGEWTEESASISPYSTRQNTANNSRRESVSADRPHASTIQPAQDSSSGTETDDTAHEDATQQSRSPIERVERRVQPLTTQIEHEQLPASSGAFASRANPTAQLLRRQSGHHAAPALLSNVTVMDDARSMRSTTPSTTSLRSRSPTSNLGGSVPEQGSAPDEAEDELVSRFVPTSTSNGSGTTSTGITTLAGTPTPSAVTSFNHTPDDKHSPHPFSQQQQHGHGRGAAFTLGGIAINPGPVSPGSTVSVSGSSGATTPAFSRSRIELKMLQEKAIADMEYAAEQGPLVPAHVYDRRNESLKSYLHLAALANAQVGSDGSSSATGSVTQGMLVPLGPEIFQGRFKAVNAELKVVQMFRDPVGESLGRLRASQRAKNLRTGSEKSPPNGVSQLQRNKETLTSSMRSAKSAVNLPVRTAASLAASMSGSKDATPLSTSVFSPPSASSAPAKQDEGMSIPSSSNTPAAATSMAAGTPITNGRPILISNKSALAGVNKPGMKRVLSRGVSFAGADERREYSRGGEDSGDEMSVHEIARQMWNEVLD